MQIRYNGADRAHVWLWNSEGIENAQREMVSSRQQDAGGQKGETTSRNFVIVHNQGNCWLRSCWQCTDRSCGIYYEEETV